MLCVVLNLVFHLAERILAEQQSRRQSHARFRRPQDQQRQGRCLQGIFCVSSNLLFINLI